MIPNSSMPALQQVKIDISGTEHRQYTYYS